MLSVLAWTSSLTAVTIDFEGLPDSTAVDNTYSGLGVVFVNAVAISAGISLNELEFPPNSGTNVATDFNGPIILNFSNPIVSFQAFFTYATGLSLVGSLGGSTVATASSLFSSNFVSSGNPPNELLELSSAGGIDAVTITGDPAGGSFVVDDVSFDTSAINTGVPEPASIVLFSCGLLGVAFGRLRPRGR